MNSNQLKERMNWPLDMKVAMTINRIHEWYRFHCGQVYVAFSGGKDSMVLVDLVRSQFPDVPIVFVDTGLEFPEIRDFVKKYDNVVWLKPKMTFVEVIEKYGFPVISKKVAMGISRYRNTTSDLQKELRLHGGTNPTSGRKQQRTISKKYHYMIDAPFKISEQCCDVMKKSPFKRYNKESGRHAFVGTMVGDSNDRKTRYIESGCNSFDDNGQSKPLSIWTEENIWEYIKLKNIPYSKIYDMGYDRTGCAFCAFGCQEEVRKGKEGRFVRMRRTHPKMWVYCMDKLGMREVLNYMDIPTGSIASCGDHPLTAARYK